MDAFSDDDYERVSDLDLTDSESDQDRADRETPSSTPPSTRKFRASDRKTIACTYSGCPKTFNRKARLEEHLRSHTNSRIFKCPHGGCDKDFLRETHLKHHVKSAHSNVRDYTCTWEGCDKSFATGTRLRRHLQAHEGREKYRCRGYENCNQTFRKHDTLKRHVLQVHEQMRPFPCNDIDLKSGQACDKAFETAEKLRNHQRTCHDQTRFSCTDCLSLKAQVANSISALSTQHFDAFFSTYSELQAHIEEFHPPLCPYCPTSFTTSKELTRHLELQHGVIDLNTAVAETYSCQYDGCDRSFTKKGNLTVHIKTVHEKKKDFVCGETEIVLPEELRPQGAVEIYGCGRVFTTKASLEDHVRSAHLGLTSLQVERRRKRKAEKRGNEDNGTDLEPQRRRPRKDKGMKKTSVLTDLTGSYAPSQQAEFAAIDPALQDLCRESRSCSANASGTPPANLKAESDEEDDDWNQLSGSMVLLDDRLYHNGEQYEYNANKYEPSFAPPQTQHDSPGTGLVLGYSKVNAGFDVATHNEPFFGGFEYEPESLKL